MMKTDFVAAANRDAAELCFCHQLSQDLQDSGHVCHWCNRVSLIANGTIKDLTFNQIEEKENEMQSSKPAFLKKLERAAKGVIVEIENEQSEVLSKPFLRVATSIKSVRDLVQYLNAETREFLPNAEAYETLLVKLLDESRVRGSGKGKSWNSNLNTAELNIFEAACREVGLKNTASRIFKQRLEAGI